jgi:transposase
MCLHPEPIQPVPAETTRVAHGAFPRGHPYLTLREEFGTLFADGQFAALFPTRGRPAEAPWRLALVTLLQFAEGLSDRQAADAVRARLDWKYLLGLELTDPGFHHSRLGEFRDRLGQAGAEVLLFEALLEQFRQRHLLKARGKQRTDSTHILAAVRLLNRLEMVGETVRHALNTVAEVAPAWLRAHLQPAWVERYAHRFEEARLPREAAERQTLALAIGEDGGHLLTAVYAPETPESVRALPAVQALREIWLQQYYREETAHGAALRWRDSEDLPPAPQRLLSPYDAEARYGKKRDTVWLGYKRHYTETCEPDQPLLLTDVQTTNALEVDSSTLPRIQAALERRDLLPAEQYVDAGYVDAHTLVDSETHYGIQLLGPAPPDTAWQSRAGAGFAAADFTIHWEEQWAECPRGQRSQTWGTRQERGQPIVQIRFARETCRACPCRSDCTRTRGAGRWLTLRPEAEHRALKAARSRQETPAFRAAYPLRSGIEGSHSQAVRRCGGRRSRYIGAVKTQVQHVLTAAALNLVRVAAWLLATPRARTRTSAFVRLVAVAV